MICDLWFDVHLAVNLSAYCPNFFVIYMWVTLSYMLAKLRKKSTSLFGVTSFVVCASVLNSDWHSKLSFLQASQIQNLNELIKHNWKTSYRCFINIIFFITFGWGFFLKFCNCLICLTSFKCKLIEYNMRGMYISASLIFWIFFIRRPCLDSSLSLSEYL